MKNLSICKALFFILFVGSVYSQNHEPSETESNIPALSDFHEVIYPIWHKAHPNKDYKLLKEMLSDVIAGAEKIYAAKLPGILRDKKQEWEKGLLNFRSSVEKYNESIKADDKTEMLISAEELHSNYEILVRIIKPVTKEADEFHKVLYMIYHKYWPNKNKEELKKAVNSLEMKAEELNTCILPKWAAKKSDKFYEQSLLLHNSTKNLKMILDTGAKDVSIDKAIEEVHSNYVALEQLFD